MAKTEAQKVSEHKDKDNVTYFTSYSKIPYSLITKDIGHNATDVFTEFGEIMQAYKNYKRGVEFESEGTGGHYVGANLRYKKVATLINKEARFLFGTQPDMCVKSDKDLGKITDEAKDNLTVLQNLVNKVLKANKFESILLKGAKDCFIGKRVALMVNFNEQYGVTVQFLPAVNFIYETQLDNPEVITKFVCYTVVKKSTDLANKRVFRKLFQIDYDSESGKDMCFIEETMHDGSGNLIEEITEYQSTLLETIPVSIIINDGLTGEVEGESEVDALKEYEKWYSKLSSSDIDAERKGMNQIKFVKDMATSTTKNLSSAPGAVWDLQTDQNLDKPASEVGTLSVDMGYSEALDTTLSRIRASMYEEVDVPDVTLDNLSGVITSGKAMKCLYWPLIVRCQEKMKAWGPALEYMIDTIIKGAMVYPNTVRKYTSDDLQPVDYRIEVVQNYPLPEDEEAEKEIDMAEVGNSLMSRKSYMVKWRQLTDHEVEEELNQIAMEKALLEGSGDVGLDTRTNQRLKGSGQETLSDFVNERDTNPVDGGEDMDDSTTGN